MSDTDRTEGLDAAPPKPSIADTLRRLERKIGVALHVAAPGTIATYDPVTQTASVQLGFMLVPRSELPVPVPVPIPPILNVRVSQVKGSTHFDHAPLAPGDTGLLVFADRCLDYWFKTLAGEPVDPQDGRVHDLADAVFFPGLAPDALVAAPITNPAARTIEAPIIMLGAGATEFALRGTAIAAQCNVLTPESLAFVLNALAAAAGPDAALINGLKTAVLGLMALIFAGLSTKVQVE